RPERCRTATATWDIPAVAATKQPKKIRTYQKDTAVLTLFRQMEPPQPYSERSHRRNGGSGRVQSSEV
ncbi:MAG: hypothetical protein E6614_03155, partial [Bradyrhizobium sp.]|nr:hypothetical protein [Bradyrhizobium sp.]